MIGRLRTPLDLPIALFVFSGLIGVWASYDPATSWRKFAMIVAAAALYYVLISLYAAPQLLEIFVWLFLSGCCALTIYFTTQHDYAVQPGKFSFITAIGLTLNRVAPQLGLHVFDPNITSGALEIGLPLAVGLAASQKEKAKKQNDVSFSPGLLAALLVSAIITFGLVMTSSRGAWLALGIVGGIAVLAISAKDVLRRYALPIGVIVVLAGLIVLLRLGDRFVPTLESFLGNIPAGNTVVSRVELWGQAWGLVQDYVYTGSGLGVFPMILSTYALLIDVPFLTHAHNLFLQVWLEQGLLGFVAFMWLAIAFGVWAWSKRHVLNCLAWAGVAAAAVMLLHGTVDALLYSSRGLPLLFLPLGLAIASTQRSADIQSAASIGRIRREAIVALFACIAVILLGRQTLAAMAYANLGSVAQSKAELSNYHWPDHLVERVRQECRVQGGACPLTEAIDLFRQALALDADNITARQRLVTLGVAKGVWRQQKLCSALI